jgi:oligogalacturonide lyase
MNRFVLLIFACFVGLSSSLWAADPPVSWVDKDTGHRVLRLSGEPGSSGFYFNINAFTPDGKLMAYNALDGIHTLDLSSLRTSLVVPNPKSSADAAPARSAFSRSGVHAIAVGRKTNSVFYSQYDSESKRNLLFKANLETGEVQKLVALPAGASVATINADETLAVGTYDEDKDSQEQQSGPNHSPIAATTKTSPEGGFLVQSENKGQMMERRLAARTPVVLFSIDLSSGKVKQLLHSTDWIGHMLFSPTDPALLMYCHEGPWQKVDRIWMIRTDGTQNHLIHPRTMAMEIAGHEFWGLDGKTVWYDWQYPKGEDFFLAGYNLETHRRIAYHMQRNEWSIHFNLTQGETLFTGDGGDPGQVAKAPDGEWIELFRPEMINSNGINGPEMWQPGVFHSEHLVNMAAHNYRLEPNVRFSPDKKRVIFTSNIFGKSYVFGVEVEKAVHPEAAEIQSTPELAARYLHGALSPTGDAK